MKDLPGKCPNILLAADKRGHYHYSLGFNRLDIYFNDISRFSIIWSLNSNFLTSNSAAFSSQIMFPKSSMRPWLLLLSMVEMVSVELCPSSPWSWPSRRPRLLELAGSWVIAKNSNHYGIAGYYYDGGGGRSLWVLVHQRVPLDDRHPQCGGQGHVHQPLSHSLPRARAGTVPW